MANKLFAMDQDDSGVYSLIYASETDNESVHEDYDIESADIEKESQTWMCERHKLLQMSHSILSPSFFLDNTRHYVSETDVSEKSSDESESDEQSDLDSIFADTFESDVQSNVGDTRETWETADETSYTSQMDIENTQEKLEQYFESIEEKERELCRRLDAEETDVIYNSIFNV